jgi:hypothetical protein
VHKKWNKDGLEVITVMVDDPDDKPVRKSNVDTVTRRGATVFRNVYMEKGFAWDKKLNVLGVPAIYVFNRDNRYVKKLPILDEKGDEKEFLDEAGYDAVEKVVEGLMKRK